MVGRRVVARVASAAAALLLCHCECAQGGDAIALLQSARGEVSRDRAGRLNQWERAQKGARFDVGDGLRTGKEGKAEVELFDGSLMRLDERTLVRFRPRQTAKKEGNFQVETGSAEIDVSTQPLRLLTRVGLAVLEAGSRVRLVADDERDLRLAVQVGMAVFESNKGERRIERGQTLVVELGEASVEGLSPTEAAKKELSSTKKEGLKGSEGGQGSEELTTILEGKGVRIKRPEEKRWQALPAGPAQIERGTQIRMPAKSSLNIGYHGSKSTFFGAGTLTLLASPQALAQVAEGRIVVQTAKEDVALLVAGGRILAKGDAKEGTKAEVLVRAKKNAIIETRSGRVEVLGTRGKESLGPGESAELSRLGSLQVGGRGPAKPHFSVLAGESFTVRDPNPPTAVGFRLGKVCPQGGAVELMRAGSSRPRVSVRDNERANIYFPPGAHRYQVRCLEDGTLQDKPSARGSVRVMRDAGNAQIPKTAPSTLVDTDGRKYNVFYQNLLPALTVRWRNPPRGAGGYVLEIRSAGGGKTQTFKTRDPTIRFESGVLKEGVHYLSFRGSSGTPRSRETVVSIEFDNAAPKASVREPANGSFRPGSTVRVSGFALKGWNVSLRGTSVPLDSQHRFSAETTVPADETALAVRLSHPGRGVHYYLRHASVAPSD